MSGAAAMEAVGPVRPPGSARIEGGEGTRATGVASPSIPPASPDTAGQGIEEGLEHKPVRRYESPTLTESQQSRFKKLAGILK